MYSKCVTESSPFLLQLFHEDGECWVYDEPLLKRLGAAKH